MQAMNYMYSWLTTPTDSVADATSHSTNAPAPRAPATSNSLRSNSPTNRLAQPTCTKAELEEDFYRAAEQGDTLKVLNLLMYFDINAGNYCSKSALLIAAENGHTDTVLALIEKGADISKTGISGKSALYVAAQNGHTDTVLALIEKGADINQPNMVSIPPIVPLLIAMRNGHIDIVSALLEKNAVADKTTKNGYTPLVMVAVKYHTEDMHWRIENRSPIDRAHNFGIVPQHLEALSKHNKIMQTLMALGIDVQADINFIRQQSNQTYWEPVANLLDRKFKEFQDQQCRVSSRLPMAIGESIPVTMAQTFQNQQRQGMVQAPLAINTTPVAIAQQVDDIILSNDLSESFTVKLIPAEIDRLRGVLNNTDIFTEQQADQLQTMHVNWQALFNGLEGLNPPQKLYFQAFASGLSQAYVLSKIIPSGMLEVVNPGDTHLEHAGWDAAKAAITMAMPKLVRGAERIASEIPFAGLAVSGAASLYLYHMETKVHNRQVLISECVINELSMDLFASKLARSLVKHPSYETLLSELNDKALEQKNPQRFKRLTQIKNTMREGLKKFNLEPRSEFDHPIGHQAIQDVSKVLKQMRDNDRLRQALQNPQSDNAVNIMRDLLIETSTVSSPHKTVPSQSTSTSASVQTRTVLNPVSALNNAPETLHPKPNVDIKEFREVKQQVALLIQNIDTSSNTGFNITGTTEQHGQLLKEKLIKIQELDLRAELFGDLANQGIDLTELLNRITQNVNRLQDHQSNTQTNTLVFQEDMNYINLEVNRIETLTLINARKIAELQKNSATQQQELQLLRGTVDQLQGTVDQLQQQVINQTPVQQVKVSTQCCEIM
ncbi:MAG: ankyrin repeat domain-containing protein [Pseudomonadota bacterium]